MRGGRCARRVQVSARWSKTSASGMAGLMRLAFAASAMCGIIVMARVRVVHRVPVLPG